MQGQTVLLRAEGIRKSYGGVQALAGVGIELVGGEVVGLAGENGSGKSTLLKVLAGLQSADAGSVELGGVAVQNGNPSVAWSMGIGLVAQEVSVQDKLTVTENLLDSRLPMRRFRIDWPAAYRKAAVELETLGLSIDPRALVGSLPLHQQQMLAIARVALSRPKVALFDEVTSSLTPAQTVEVYRLIDHLKAAGTAVVYISHRLHEYFDLTSRVIVLRDGAFAGCESTSDLTVDRLVQMMVGRQMTDIFQRPDKPSARRGGVKALRVSRLGSRTLSDISFDVAPGEIVGISGQAGSGRTSLAETLFGQWRYTGAVEVAGARIRLRSAREAMRAGIALVPENRKRGGLVLGMSIRENIAMASWGRDGEFSMRRAGAEQKIGASMVQALRIKAPGLECRVDHLSGGNQQKVVMAKWISQAPAIFIVDEPTRGVDVGAKAEIYSIIEQLAAGGSGVVVISSELLELIRLSDRILVMSDGRIVGEESAEDASEESLTALAFRR